MVQSTNMFFHEKEQKYYQENVKRLKQSKSSIFLENLLDPCLVKIKLEQKWYGFFDFGDKDILSIKAKTQWYIILEQ